MKFPKNRDIFHETGPLNEKNNCHIFGSVDLEAVQGVTFVLFRSDIHLVRECHQDFIDLFRPIVHSFCQVHFAPNLPVSKPRDLFFFICFIVLLLIFFALEFNKI